MGYRNALLQKYLDDAAAKIPAPGGGSVSALAGALGAAMGSMTARFTIGKKKFKDAEPQMQAALETFEDAREQLTRLMEEDTQLYERVLDAYRLPAETPDERAERDRAIQEKLRDAMSVPLEIVRQARRVAVAAADTVDACNPMLITDMAVCAVLAEAACQGARLNVDINLKEIADHAFVSRVLAELTDHCNAAVDARNRVTASVTAYLNR